MDSFCSGDLHVYPDLGLVKVGSEEIRLGPVNMRVLLVLIENAGKVVSRAEIFDLVWKNQVINDDTLTRCISDIRTRLSKYSSQSNLIETLPKRGYRWLSDVSQVDGSIPPEKDWKHYSYRALVGLVLLFVLSSSVLWIASQFVRPNQVILALIHIQTDQPSHLAVASDLEDMLRKKILATDNLRFLSSSALARYPEKPYSYLSREFGSQWVVEGRIRQYQDKIRVSLNLVDARTAIVFYARTVDIDNQESELDGFCNLFVADMLRLLSG
jgi:DNA-binding winged helix-turn-helix (wHTH) protein